MPLYDSWRDLVDQPDLDDCGDRPSARQRPLSAEERVATLIITAVLIAFGAVAVAVSALHPWSHG